MIRLFITGGCLLCILATEAFAQQKQRFKGWEVLTEKDRFSTGSGRVIGVTLQGRTGLAIRCMEGEKSVAIIQASFGQGRYSELDALDVKFRADERPVIETEATALDDKMIQVSSSEEIIRSMRGAKEFAFRLEFKGTNNVVVFKAGEADRVIDAVEKACPPKPEKKPAEAQKKADEDQKK